ncbi:MAG: TerC family protein [Pirellulaceae bacterium]|nr:TerC family protein [Pirellulaceae bacterium]
MDIAEILTVWLIPLLTLSAMEIVLGIDNIVFISILSSKLPEEEQAKGRHLGLLFAMGTRILLLFGIGWVVTATNTLFSWSDLGIHLEPLVGKHDFHEINAVSVRDIILFSGGLFLIWKSVTEIHEKLSHHEEGEKKNGKKASFRSVIIQIAILDIVFSLDSVITAVGMVDEIWVMVISVILAVGVMMAFAGPISHFVEANPTLKMLALSFLILIGVMLVSEGVGTEIEKGYVYFAMAFALLVEVLNIRFRYKQKGRLQEKRA